MRSWSDFGRSTISRNISFSIFLLPFVILAQSQPSGFGTWIYPVDQGDNPLPEFNYLDSVNASWTSKLDAPWLHLWCVSNTNPPEQQHFVAEKLPSFTQSHLVALDYHAASNRCHFQLTPGPEAGGNVDSLASPNFKILQESNRKPKIWTLSASVDRVKNQPNNSVDAISTTSWRTTASTSPALKSPASTSPALKSPASTSPASTSPALKSPALTSPASTSPASTSPASTSPASKYPASTFPASTSPALTSPASTSDVPSRAGLSTVAKAGIGLSCRGFALALIAGAICASWIQ